VWLCGTDLDAQQFPAHRQHNPAYTQKIYNLSNLQYFLGRNLFLRQDPKIMMESYDVSFGILPHQKFG